MSTKIKVSYQDQKELELVIRLLHPIIKSYKVSRSCKGNFRKAYIYLDEQGAKPEETMRNHEESPRET